MTAAGIERATLERAVVFKAVFWFTNKRLEPDTLKELAGACEDLLAFVAGEALPDGALPLPLGAEPAAGPNPDDGPAASSGDMASKAKVIEILEQNRREAEAKLAEYRRGKPSFYVTPNCIQLKVSALCENIIEKVREL